MSNGEKIDQQEDQEQYIGTYFDFQKYLINPEFKKTFTYLTKELGIANLNPFEIFIITWQMEIVAFLNILGADASANLFLSDIYTTSLLSRSKHGFGAKLLVSQITKGEYLVKGDERIKRRFFNFGKKKSDEVKETQFEGGGY